MPPMPEAGVPVLIQAAIPPDRNSARTQLRDILRQVLSKWMDCPTEAVTLRESDTGPILENLIEGQDVNISLSYSGNQGWISLQRGGKVGLDIMHAQSFPEMREIARHYLPPKSRKTIEEAEAPELVFALAWTEMEARLKFSKKPLSEFCEAADLPPSNTHAFSLIQSDRLVVTVCSEYIT